MRIWKLKKMAVYFQGEKAIEIGKLLASLEQNSGSFFLILTKYLLTMYKHSFSGTGDGFALENFDDAYSLMNIEFRSDTFDKIKKYKIALPVISDLNILY